ncbi:MAG: FHA domain-containing protein [Lachnospiraceae bacterium]|nr:FHA domain-containing protein [Lachnospiraceae bacterium]
MGILPIDPASFIKWYKKNSRSLLLIIAAGCMCAAVLFQFISAFTVFSSVDQYFYRLGLGEMMDVLKVLVVLFSLIGMIPAIFKTIGLFFQWFAEMNGSFQRHKTGLTFINISAIISLVYMGILYVVLMICLILAMAALSNSSYYYYRSGSAIGINILLMFFVTGFVVVEALYYIKIMGICKALKDGIDGHPHTFKGSMFVIVLLGVIAFFSFVSSIFSGVIGIFNGIFVLAYQILLMLCLISLREDMNRMAMGLPTMNRFAFEGVYGGSTGVSLKGGKVCVLDGVSRREVVLSNGMMIHIGTNPQKSQLVVDANYTAVSGQHVLVAYMGQAGYYVTDCSVNGTFLQNGARLQKGVQTQLARQTVLILANQCRVMLM